MNSIFFLVFWYLEIVYIGVEDFDVGDVFLFGIDFDGLVGKFEIDNSVVVLESIIQLIEYQFNEIS